MITMLQCTDPEKLSNMNLPLQVNRIDITDKGGWGMGIGVIRKRKQRWGRVLIETTGMGGVI